MTELPDAASVFTPMRCRFGFLIALEFSVAAALLITIGIRLSETHGNGDQAAGTANAIRPGTPELTPADAVFLPFEEAPSGFVSRPLVPGGGTLNLAMLSGWYAGRCDRFLSEEGEWSNPELYEFVIEEDGRWACAAIWWGWCQAEVRHARGHVTLVDGRVLFEADGIDGTPTRKVCAVLPVWWGERLYLIGPGEVAGFCNSVNWGGEPRRAIRYAPEETYVRATMTPFFAAGSVEAPVGDGPPLLPEPAARWILRAPIRGQLTELLMNGSWRADIGSLNGVFRGMTLRAKAGEVSLRVEQVGTDSCIVRADTKPALVLAPGTMIWSDAKGADLYR